MTQIGEGVQIGMVDADDLDCPFDHDNPEPPTVENQLIGSGTKLATKMGNGTSTHLYAPLVKKCEQIDNPKDRSGHPFANKAKVVHIRDRDAATGKDYEHRYPVTCAAHHLVPAQEALKQSHLLAFMVKKGETAKLKDKDFSKGVVWANVGYEVNGAENGIYLPGSYAVGGGRGGLKLWVENDDMPDKEEEDVTEEADPASPQLYGRLNEISATNRKWQYVRQAVAKAPGQFHDRHVDYSNFVTSVLDKIFEDYRRRYFKSFIEFQCPKCEERAEKARKQGVPTPFGLVARLNGLSRNLAAFLNGSTWRRNIYTSKWGQAYMEAVKAGNKAAGPDT